MWYLSGWLCLGVLLWFNDRRKEMGIEVSLDDIIQGTCYALAGALLLIPVLFFTYEEFIVPLFPKINKEKILWRSKKSKVNHILFGDKKK